MSKTQFYVTLFKIQSNGDYTKQDSIFKTVGRMVSPH